MSRRTMSPFRLPQRHSMSALRPCTDECNKLRLMPKMQQKACIEEGMETTTRSPWGDSSLGQRTHRQNTFASKLNIRFDHSCGVARTCLDNAVAESYFSIKGTLKGINPTFSIRTEILFAESGDWCTLKSEYKIHFDRTFSERTHETDITFSLCHGPDRL